MNTHTDRATVKQLNHVGVVVPDLPAAIAFFTELGLATDGQATVSGRTVDLVTGVEGIRSDVAMMRTPDGHGALELIQIRTPAAPAGDPAAPATTPGLRHVAFEVEDIEDVIDRLRPHGAELVGELAQYEDSWRLCYLRGPAGIIIELAEEVR